MKPIGNGTLFASDVSRLQKDFNKSTRGRYEWLRVRMGKKGIAVMPFTLEQFRAHALKALGGRYDGAVTCRYCRRVLNFEDAVGDHAVPLSRGGSPDLDNIDFICSSDNDQKGSCTPSEWVRCLEFFQNEVPLACTDILSRLQKATKLAASLRFNMARISELKETGAWQKAGKRNRKPAFAKSAAPEEEF